MPVMLFFLPYFFIYIFVSKFLASCLLRRARFAALTLIDPISLDRRPRTNYKEVCRRFIQVFGHQVRNRTDCIQCCSTFCLCNQRLFGKEIIAFDFGSESTWLKHCGSDGYSRLSMQPTIKPCSCVSNHKISSSLCDCFRAEFDGVSQRPSSCTVAESVELYEFLIRHMFRRRYFHHLPLSDISFVLCEPRKFCEEMRCRLIELLICHLKVSEVCFIPKSIAIAMYAGIDTCLIIDSGANNTVITPVINQHVITAGVRHIPVGGSHLTRLLLEAIRLKGLEFDITETSSVSLQIKRECYIALNTAAEARKKIATRILFVTGSRGNESHVVKVRLGHELYQAAENLYLCLDLPRLIVDSISTVSLECQRRLLANIILSGGNSRLTGLGPRLARDLEAILPSTTAQSVCVKDPRLMTGRSDAVIGASFVQNWNDTSWFTRRDFILDGLHSLESGILRTNCDAISDADDADLLNGCSLVLSSGTFL